MVPAPFAQGIWDQHWSVAAARQVYNRITGRKGLLWTIHCISLEVAGHEVDLLPFRAKENK